MKRRIGLAVLLLALSALALGIAFNVWWAILAGGPVGLLTGVAMVPYGGDAPQIDRATYYSQGYGYGGAYFVSPGAFHHNGGEVSRSDCPNGGDYGGGSSCEGGSGSSY
jgi:hypothetical protein